MRRSGIIENDSRRPRRGAYVASLVSCNKEVNPVEGAEYTYSFILGREDDSITKAILDNGITKWESKDLLGFYVKGSSSTLQKNRSGVIDITKEPVTFSVTTSTALSTGNKVYAYYPFSSENGGVDIDVVKMSFPTYQLGKMTDMPMLSNEYTLGAAISSNANIPTGEIVMQNLGGVFQFNVFSTNEAYRGEVLKAIRFNSTTSIAGPFSHNLTNGTSVSGYSERSVFVEKTVGAIAGTKEESVSLMMTVAPGTYSGEVIVYTDRAEYTFNMSSPKTVERSHIKPLNVDLQKGERRSVVFTDRYEIVYGEPTTGWTVLDAKFGIDYWGLATESYYIQSPVIEDLSKVKSIKIYGKTYGSVSGNSNKMDIKIGSSTKKTLTFTNQYTEQEYNLAEGTLTGSSAFKFVCQGGSTSGTKAGLRIQRITIRYVDDSWAPKILDGEISQVPARSSEGRYTIQTKNIGSDLVVFNYDGIDFDEIDIENGSELVYTVSDNDSKEVKNGTITVALASDNSVTGTISISQAAARFSAARTSVDLKAPANSQTTVTITSDFDWTISGVDAGYTVSPLSFTYDPDATNPEKQTITIKALNANTTAITDPLGAFNIVNSNSGLGSIEITVNQLSSKLPAPEIGTVTPKDKDKQVTVQWSKVTNAAKYEYFLIDDELNIIESTRTQTADNNVLSATIDVPEYAVDYYFGIISVAAAGGEWENSTEAMTDETFNLTEPEESTGITYEWSFPQSTAVANSTGIKDMNNTTGTLLQSYTSRNAVGNGNWSNTTQGTYFNCPTGGYYRIQVPITSTMTKFSIEADLFAWKNSAYAEKTIDKVTYYTTKKSTEVVITPSGSPKTTASGCYSLSSDNIVNSDYIPTTDTNQYLYIRIYMQAGNDGFESLSVTVE